MKMTVHITGLKEIKAALHELPRASAMGVMRRVLKKRAKPMADSARSNVRVVEGNLKRSISVSTKLTRRQRRQHTKMSKDSVEVFVGASADPAAHLLEFGSIHNLSHPFLRPAWDKHKMALVQGIGADMWYEIEKTVARVAKRNAKKG